MWHSDEFQQYLSEEGHGDVWMETVYPGMKTAVLSAMLSTQEIIEYRKVELTLLKPLFHMAA